MAEESERANLESHVRANLLFWLETVWLIEQRLLTLAFEPVNDRSDSPDADSMVHQFMTAHLFVLSVRHIEVRLRRLARWNALSPAAAKAADAFLEEYEAEELKDLRDALEHSDDYAAGTGRFQKRIGLLQEGWIPGVKWTHSRDSESGPYSTRVSAIRLFGRDYPVGRLMDLLRAVDTSL